MKHTYFFLIFIILICILSRITIINFNASRPPKDSLNSMACSWPMCERVAFTQVGYIGGIIDPNTIAQNNLSETQLSSNILEVPLNVEIPTIWKWDKNNEPVPKPHFSMIPLSLIDKNTIEYYIKGVKVDESIFMQSSLGAKASISGVAQMNILGPDSGSQYTYSVKSINILETVKEYAENCTSCKTFSNEIMEFKYSPTWQIAKDNYFSVVLRRKDYYPGEKPTDCTIGSVKQCDCADQDKACQYEIVVELNIGNPDQYLRSFIEPENGYKIHSNFPDSLYMKGNNADGTNFFAPLISEPSKNKHISLLIKTKINNLNTARFPLENNTLMPLVIFGSFKSKN